MPAGTAAAGNSDDAGRGLLIERRYRHRPRRGHRCQAEADGKRGSDENFHRHMLSFRMYRYAAVSNLRKRAKTSVK